MSQADPAPPHPGESPESLRAWYDQHRIGDAVLYDITVQAATSLSALLVQRQLAATDDHERERWAARVHLVCRQQAALNPGDRGGLIAQQQAWLNQTDVLTAKQGAGPA
jgi:hypothetical protein